MKNTGIVKEINDKFGFIACFDGPDRFFHWSSVSNKSLKPFHHYKIGDKVSFIPVEKDGKKQAQEVEIVYEERKAKIAEVKQEIKQTMEGFRKEVLKEEYKND